MASTKRLIIFAREPQLGQVKTRLAQSTSDEIALELYQAFLKDTFHMMDRVKCDDKVIYYTGSKDPQFLKQFQNHYSYHQQQGHDLGERMLHAFTHSHKEKMDKTIVVGTDCLYLASQHIHAGFDMLDDHDIVIGPCTDGGYYLIGLTSPQPFLFDNMEWGTADVFNETLNRIERSDCTHNVLPELDDIDHFSNLKRFVSLPSAKEMAPQTYKIYHKFELDRLD